MTQSTTTPESTDEPAPRRSDTAELWAAFIRWLLFGVALAVLPVLVNWMSLLTRGLDGGTGAVFGGGELLLVSAVLGATAAGDLMGVRSRRFIVFRSVLTGLNIVLLLFASLWFADIAATIRAETDIDRGFVTMGSAIVFAFEVVIGACSFIVTRLEDRR